MKRRELLGLMGALALGMTSGDWAESKTRCLPRISGPLWWLDPESARWSESQWRDDLDRQRRIVFDLLWLVNAPGAMDGLQTMLDLCAKRKVQVILDTGSRQRQALSPDSAILSCMGTGPLSTSTNCSAKYRTCNTRESPLSLPDVRLKDRICFVLLQFHDSSGHARMTSIQPMQEAHDPGHLLLLGCKYFKVDFLR